MAFDPPGVFTLTSVRAGQGSTPRNPYSRLFTLGLAERGRVDTAVLISNMKEFSDEFGSASYSFLNDELVSFFEEGGRQAYVARTVGASATKGTKNLLDRAGSPIATIRLDAISAGAWSSDLTVAVTDGTIANTVNISLAYKAGATIAPEVYLNLGPDPVAIVQAINARSRWVTATALTDATVAPGNRPAVLAAAAFSAGTDDRASVTGALAAGKLSTAFPLELGSGVVTVPGFLHTDIAAIVIAHCKATSRIGKVSGPEAETPTEFQTALDTMRALSDGEYLGAFYPWVPADINGTRKNIPPTGYIAGARARVIEETSGIWQPPAGKWGEARFVKGVKTAVDQATNAAIYAKNGSVVRLINGKARPYGYRSLSTDDNYRFLSSRDLLNALSFSCKAALEDEMFDGIDREGQTLNKCISICKGIVSVWARAGAFYAGDDDPGYLVTGVTNPTERTITVNVGVRPREATELIIINVVKAAVTAAV